MEETILLKILEAQHDILAELRLLRQTISSRKAAAQPATRLAAQAALAAPVPETSAPKQPTATPAPTPQTTAQPAAEPVPETPVTRQPLAPPAPAPQPEPEAAPAREPEAMTPPEPVSPPRQSHSGGMLTMDDLADIGGQFLDTPTQRRGRVKPVDASDLSSSILDDIKAKNRAKRNAFSEFDKFNRGR